MKCDLEKTQCRYKNGLPSDCFHLPLLNDAALNEPCQQGTSYDYFSNSSLSFILSFSAIGAIIAGNQIINTINAIIWLILNYILGTVGLVCILKVCKDRENLKEHVSNERKLRNSFKGRSRQDLQIYSG